MSTRNILWNQQYTLYPPQGGSIIVGPKGQVVSSGTNQVEGDEFLDPHPYSLVYYDRGDGTYVFKTRCGAVPDTNIGLLQVECSQDRAWTSNDDSELYGKLREAYDDSDFNAGVFAGELGETTDMLAGNLRRLAQAGRLARRGRLSEAAKVLGKHPRRSTERAEKSGQGIDERWLELQYGWKPLMGDISNLADLIASKDKPRTRRIWVQKSIGMTPYTNYTNMLAEGKGKYSKRIIAYMREPRPLLAVRLGLQDPFSVAWELLPFSFVADWVYPIGDYIEARSFASRAEGLFVITTRRKFNVRCDKRKSTYTPTGCWVLQPEPGLLAWHRRVELTREVVATLPQVDLPVWKNPLGGPGERLANAVALVSAIFGGGISIGPKGS